VQPYIFLHKRCTRGPQTGDRGWAIEEIDEGEKIVFYLPNSLLFIATDIFSLSI
jgi:hypothetical protein